MASLAITIKGVNHRKILVEMDAERFEKHYQELPAIVQTKAERKEKLFHKDPFHCWIYRYKI